jgi:hypothetical protein
VKHHKRYVNCFPRDFLIDAIEKFTIDLNKNDKTDDIVEEIKKVAQEEGKAYKRYERGLGAFLISL